MPTPVAVLFCDGDPGVWLPTVVALGRAAPGVPVVVAGPDPDVLAPLVAAGATSATATSLAAAVNQAWPAHVIAVLSPVTLPDDAFRPALAILDGDRRVATVGFLAEVGEGDDAVTRRLRTTGPDQDPAPVPFATGPVVMLSRFAFSAVGPLIEAGPAEAVADFSLRARRRGFLDVVDPSTQVNGTAPPLDRRWVLERHPFVAALLDANEAPLAVVRSVAGPKANGLRILVDGSWLGSWEMGTQVQAVAMVQALARRDDVARVTMALPAVLPAAALELLAGPKVDARADTGGDLAGLGPADIVHRPFQPDWPLDVGAWRREAARTVVTILDLIAYTVGSYHPSGEHWMAHRRTIGQTVAEVDGVVVISDDVATQIRRERLPVENDRLFVVGLGTDHLQWDAPEAMPAALAGFGRFVLVLGADYAHKNRDLAVRAHAELVRRGLAVGLVLVGPSVLHGSSQVTEAAASASGRTVRLPNVPAAERNWLLRHSDLVLYPTSAEGFGLVPHEAARLGTPTVMVPVGPLVALAAALPVSAATWSPEALADASEALLWDPTLAAAQVRATLAAGRDLTWDATAARLVDVYRSLLARPAVR